MIPDYAEGASLLVAEAFDPAPWLYLLYGKVYLVLGGLIFLLGYYCVLWRSPNGTKKNFKRVYAIMLTFSFGMHLFALSGTPIFIIPYRAAVFSSGFAYDLGISTNVQICLIFTCSQGIASYNLALFYFRIEALLPTNHFFRKYGIPYFFYGYSFTAYLPAFFIGYFEGIQNQDGIKKQFFDEFGYVTQYLWDPRTVVYEFSFKDAFLIIFLIYVFIACGIPIVIIAPVLYCSMYFLSEFRKRASKRTVDLQWSLLKTLIAQVSVYFTFFGGSIVFIGVCLVFGIHRSDLISIAACIFAASPSIGVLMMLVINGYYRRALFGCFRRKNEVSSSSNRKERASTVITRM